VRVECGVQNYGGVIRGVVFLIGFSIRKFLGCFLDLIRLSV